MKLANASCAGQPRFTIQYTQVLMSMTEAKAVPWPDDWRKRIEAVLRPKGEGAANS